MLFVSQYAEKEKERDRSWISKGRKNERENGRVKKRKKVKKGRKREKGRKEEIKTKNS